MNSGDFRVVDSREYIGMLKELVLEGREVSMVITGSSMSPFLCHGRDWVFFRSPKAPLRRGDIVFYQREDGGYVVHRIYKVNKDGGFDIVGDAQREIERNVRPEQIFAVVTYVKRNGKIIKPGEFTWEFFRKWWLRILPFRRALMIVYAAFRRVF